MRVRTAAAFCLAAGCAAWMTTTRGASQGAAPSSDRIRAAERRLAEAPGNPAVMFDLGVLRAAAGDRTAALALLERIVAAKTGIDPEGTAFDRFKDDAAYRALVAGIRRDFPPVLTSALAFTVPEPTLIPEGIAYDPAGDRFFVGSIHEHKIAAVADGRAATDFVPPNRDGLGAVVGLRVDPRRALLWAAAEFRVTSDGGAPTTRNGVAAYDLRTGRLVRRAILDAEGHLLNDLVVTSSGDVYVTDSRGHQVYRLPAGGSRLEQVLDASQIQEPNGIALSPDESRAFIAAWPSIVVMEIRTKRVTPLRHSLDIVTAGIDGLYWHNGSLVGVQNAVHPGRVVRFRLSGDLGSVERMDVLASYDPRFEAPTTGAVAKQGLYVIANSQLRKIDPQGGLAVPASQLEPVTILKVPLGW